jgi:hypothetical protein
MDAAILLFAVELAIGRETFADTEIDEAKIKRVIVDIKGE